MHGLRKFYNSTLRSLIKARLGKGRGVQRKGENPFGASKGFFPFLWSPKGRRRQNKKSRVNTVRTGLFIIYIRWQPRLL